MKVRVIKNAFYNLAYLEEGRIIDFKGDVLPSWAEAVEPSEKKPEEKDTRQDVVYVPNNDINPTFVEAKYSADYQKEEYLDNLISEGIEKNILIEDADKKSIDEQISELEQLLGKNGKAI